MAATDFWGNKELAQKVIDETGLIRAKVQPLAALIQKTDDLEILRSLAEEDVVRLILDGTVVKVRLDRRATNISLLVVLSIAAMGKRFC